VVGVDVVIEVLFSILTAIVLTMIYRLMTWLSRIEKQVVELRTEIKWVKAYILKISNNNTGGKYENTQVDNNT
jgi:hypothetical protein